VRVIFVWQPANTTTPEDLVADVDSIQLHTIRGILARPPEDRGEAVIWVNALTGEDTWSRQGLRLKRVLEVRRP